jgi:cob(I)alamin adenosyltransferase
MSVYSTSVANHEGQADVQELLREDRHSVRQHNSSFFLLDGNALKSQQVNFTRSISRMAERRSC